MLGHDVCSPVKRMGTEMNPVSLEPGLAPFGDLPFAFGLLTTDATFHRVKIDHNVPTIARGELTFHQLTLDFDLVHK